MRDPFAWCGGSVTVRAMALLSLNNLSFTYSNPTLLDGITLHIETLYGENNHHIAETCFKGLARALRAAVTLDPRQAGRVPSTKGML